MVLELEALDVNKVDDVDVCVTDEVFGSFRMLWCQGRGMQGQKV